MEHLISIARNWITTPYAHGKSEINQGADCVQFIAAVYKERFPRRKLELPEYLEHFHIEPHLNFENLKLSKTWVKTNATTPNIGDIAVMQLGQYRYHAGFIAQKNDLTSLIHVRTTIGVVEEEFSNFWRSKIIYYYRIF